MWDFPCIRAWNCGTVLLGLEDFLIPSCGGSVAGWSLAGGGWTRGGVAGGVAGGPGSPASGSAAGWSLDLSLIHI